MQNRKDLLQAHRLMTQRAALALLQGEPDPPDRPLRRLNVGTFSSILVGVMVAAVFGIWGVIAPGGAQGLKAPGTLIIDSQTGTSYVWCQGGKLLCPVVNYASARLALASSSPNQRTVSQASLSTYPRGPEIGIPGLPPLPQPDMLAGQPWSVCVQAVANPVTGQQHTVTTLVGGQSVGGHGIGGKALIVQASGSDWVIWGGQRMPIPANTQGNVLIALGATQQEAETVPLAWLNAFPLGPDFTAPKIHGLGSPVTGPGGGTARIGQVFTTGNLAGTTPQYYVMLSGGLAPITPTQAILLEAELNASQRTITPALVATHQSPIRIPVSDLPKRLPAIQNYAAAAPLCVVYSGSAGTAPGPPQVTVGGKVPSGGMPILGGGGLNQLTLPPGKAALVGAVSGAQPGAVAAGQPPAVASYFLVTGGLRYGLASSAVVGYLGYTVGQRTLLPASVVALLPEGHALDPSQARDPVGG
jgi:type VII secretion protein EccB